MKFVTKPLLIVAVILINLFVLIQIGVIGAVFWLNSDNGQEYSKQALSDALSASGYDVEFDRFAYRFPQGLAIPNLKISQEQTLIASMKDIGVNIDIIDIIFKRLEMSVHGQALTLHTMPATSEQPDAEPKALTPFHLPDLYFKNITLSNLHFETVEIVQSDTSKLSFTPTLFTQIDLTDSAIDLQSTLNVKNGPEWMPEKTEINVNFDTQSLQYKINNFNILSKLFDVKINAEGELLESEIDAFNGSGSISFSPLKDQGLEDINVNVIIPSILKPMDGRLSIDTAYHEHPLNLSLGYSLNEKILSLNTIKASAPDLGIDGNLNLNLDNMRADGAIYTRISSLLAYKDIVGADIPPIQADISVHLSSSETEQAIKSTLKNITYDQNTVEEITLKTSCIELISCLPESLSMQFKHASIAHILTLPKGNLSINKSGDNFTLNTDIKGIYNQEFSIYGSSSFDLKDATPNIQNMNFTLKQNNSNLHLKGSANQHKLDISASSKYFEFSDIALDQYGLFLDFFLAGDINLSGSPASPEITTKIKIENLPEGNQQRVAMTVNADMKNNQAKIDITGSGDGINRLNGTISTPIRLSLQPFEFKTPEKDSLNGVINFAIQSTPLSMMFLPPEHHISGILNGDITLSGSVLSPTLAASIHFQNGSYEYKKLGVSLKQISVSSHYKDNIFQINTFHATDGLTGNIDGKATIYAQAPQQSTARITTNALKLFNSQTISGAITSDIKLANQYLKGDITLGRFSVTIPEKLNSLIPALTIKEETEHPTNLTAQKRASDIRLNMNVRAKDQIFVRGWGLDAEFGGDLNIEGTATAPEFHGDFTAIRGRYEEFGKSFELEDSTLRFQGSIPPSPYLNIVAVNKSENLVAKINLLGEFQQPKLSLSSVPSLPQDEIMARILFGKSMEKITAMQAIQLKNTIDRFTGKGGQGFDPLGTLRNLTGLDDIRIEDDGEDTSVGVGKYLTDKVYLEFEQGSEAGSGGAKVQIEVSPSIQVESEVGQDAKAGAGILWHWKY